MRIAGLFIILMAAAAAIAVQAQNGSKAEEGSFKGVIADSQCALNVHSLTKSHKEMLQDKTIGSTPADCVWYCVKQRGGRFVLQNRDKVYKLDDQSLSRDFAAKKVEVFGTLDPQTNTIHIHRMELLPDDDKSVPAPR
jgi:hypothetical protein